MQIDKVTITVTLDESSRDYISSLSSKRNISISQVVSQLIKEKIESDTAVKQSVKPIYTQYESNSKPS
jgi:hypothetical protein